MFNKPLILALLVSLSFNGLFGYLSYKFHSDKAVAESKLELAIQANSSLLESSVKADKACTLADDISTGFKREEQGLERHTEAIVDKLDRLTKTPATPKATIVAKEETNSEESRIANLDDKLPPDVISLLSESCHNSKGEACANTR